MSLEFQKKRKKNAGVKKNFEEVMVENFPNLIKDIRHKPIGSRSLVNPLRNQ